jgi:hypothetical protein
MNRLQQKTQFPEKKKKSEPWTAQRRRGKGRKAASFSQQPS